LLRLTLSRANELPAKLLRSRSFRAILSRAKLVHAKLVHAKLLRLLADGARNVSAMRNALGGAPASDGSGDGVPPLWS